VRIRDILDPHRIVLDVQGDTKRDILTLLAGTVIDTHKSIDGNRLVEVLLKREETSTTAIADGIAIPHGKMILGEEVICTFGRSLPGLNFDSVDGKPTHLFFLLISPESHPSLHLRWLAHLAVLLKNADLRQRLMEADSADAVLSVIEEEEEARAAEAPASDQ